MWLCTFLVNLAYRIDDPTPIGFKNITAEAWEKCNTAIRIAKHIELHYHYTQECTDKKITNLHHTKSSENLFDSFTKLLKRVLLEKFRASIGVTTTWTSCRRGGVIYNIITECNGHSPAHSTQRISHTQYLLAVSSVSLTKISGVIIRKSEIRKLLTTTQCYSKRTWRLEDSEAASFRCTEMSLKYFFFLNL